MTTYEVKDGARTLQFDGVKLGSSTSRKRGSVRWIEFELYKTESGSYILSRVGVSVVYHSGACELVDKYKLKDMASHLLPDNPFPCELCQPTLEAPIVFPEKLRHWAQVSEEPQAVLDALYKYDEGGARYLTAVAKRVLEEAADNDDSIDLVYRFEHIP
jgi:hypothetical protein